MHSHIAKVILSLDHDPFSFVALNYKTTIHDTNLENKNF